MHTKREVQAHTGTQCVDLSYWSRLRRWPSATVICFGDFTVDAALQWQRQLVERRRKTFLYRTIVGHADTELPSVPMR